MFVLKQLRRKKKINQTELARAIGVSLRTIQLYEKKNANIPIKNLTKIADYFGVTIAELYTHEVNEEVHGYALNTDRQQGAVTYKEWQAGKCIMSVPLVAAEQYGTYCESYDNADFISGLPRIGFVVETNDPRRHLAFEIVGNAMDDGTSDSIPNGAIVLGQEVALNDFNVLGKTKRTNAIIIYGKNLLCKEIADYDDEAGRIRCHSLNTSPEYADFDIALDEVKQLFKVIKKQTG